MRIVGNAPSGGKKPTTPTIGTATDGGTGTTVSVAFTPSTYIGKGTITYTATSSPGSITGTGSGSPITVSGLTTGTAYTFTVRGTTNYGVLSDSSAASNSVTPASPSSFDSIATFSPSGVSTITFNSIPSTYKSLQLRYSVNIAAAGNGIGIRLNGASTNYTTHAIEGNGSTAYAGGATSLDSMWLISVPGNGNVASSYPNVGIVDIIDYASTSKYKTLKAFVGADNNNTTVNGSYIDLMSGLYQSTTAVSSLTFRLTGSTMTGTVALYGVK